MSSSGVNWRDAEFLASAVKAAQYPKHRLPEICLLGRSNVGKSSLINCLVLKKGLARTSGQPGRTQTINFYRIDRFSLVDLPGYGFARVPEAVRRRWKPMIESYLRQRPNLIGCIQLVDIRHDPSDDDRIMAEWIRAMARPAHVVATKADKLSRSRQLQNSRQIEAALGLPTTAFSAETRLGRHQVAAILMAMVQQRTPFD